MTTKRRFRRESLPSLAILADQQSGRQERIAALCSLKSELIGNGLRKHLAILNGIAPQLGLALSSSQTNAFHGASPSVNGNGESHSSPSIYNNLEWTDDLELRLQATYVTGSLATGGWDFAETLIDTDSLIPSLLQGLNPSTSHPVLVLNTLKCLVDLADAIWVEDLYAFEDEDHRPQLKLADQIYTVESVSWLHAILTHRPSEPIWLSHADKAIQLITRTACSSDHKGMLAKSGILEQLSSMLASTMYNLKYRLAKVDRAVVETLPPPLPRRTMFRLFEALATVVLDSSILTNQLLYSQGMRAVFPLGTKERDLHLENPSSSASPLWRTKYRPQDRILPDVPVAAGRSDPKISRNFPPLGSRSTTGTVDQQGGSPNQGGNMVWSHVGITSGEEFESPLFACLIDIVRENSGLDSLAAARLLATLLRRQSGGSEAIAKRIDRVIGCLIVPLILKTIEDSSDTEKSPTLSLTIDEREERKLKLENSLLVFFLLIENSVMLQRAAVDVDAVKIICKVLKQSMEATPRATPKAWTPDPSWPERILEPVAPELLHVFRCRALALLALSGIAHKDDTHRRLIIEQGAVLHVHDSLFPALKSDRTASKPASGTMKGSRAKSNPPKVLIAACQAAIAISRSVSVLRTSLIDAKISQPVSRLLHHDKMEVKIAATDVLINLLLQFSPMKDGLVIEGKVVDSLCEHAHAQNLELRLSSLWALKHLVLNVSVEIKKDCLRKLGPDWLIQIISTGSDASVVGLGSTNAAGERVDLLNATYESSMDIDDDDVSFEGDMDVSRSDAQTRRLAAALEAHRSNKANVYRSELLMQERALQRTELRIQEKALHLVRNLIGEASTITEMTSYIFEVFTASRLLNIIAAKLRPKPHSQSQLTQRSHGGQSGPKVSATGSLSSSSAQQQYWGSPLESSHQPAEILTAAVGILVHIANASQDHRNLLMGQADMLRNVVTLYDHPNALLRRACLWLVINLTFVEVGEPQHVARNRAVELHRLGFEPAIRKCVGDDELDCRERAKTAVEQMDDLLSR